MQVPFFAGMVKLMPYIIWKLTRPSDRQNNFVKICYFKKNNKVGGTKYPNFKTYYKIIIIPDHDAAIRIDI